MYTKKVFRAYDTFHFFLFCNNFSFVTIHFFQIHFWPQYVHNPVTQASANHNYRVLQSLYGQFGSESIIIALLFPGNLTPSEARANLKSPKSLVSQRSTNKKSHSKSFHFLSIVREKYPHSVWEIRPLHFSIPIHETRKRRRLFGFIGKDSNICLL